MGQAIGSVLNVTDYVFPPISPSYDERHELLVKLPLGPGADVPAMLLPPSVCQGWRGAGVDTGSMVSVCVVYFHANACDIGESVADLAAIRDGVFGGDAVGLAPEYPGYGLLWEAAPSVESVDLVAQAAWRFCVEDLGFRPEQIVLWGRSIGTGPAAALAHARASCDGVDGIPGIRPVGALVLLAPFTSVSDVVQAHSNALVASLVSPMWEVAALVADPALVAVPLCVVHPKDDEVVPFAQGQAVLESASTRLRFGFWLSGAGHNFDWDENCAQAVRGFLAEHIIGVGGAWGLEEQRELRGPGATDGPRRPQSAEPRGAAAAAAGPGAPALPPPPLGVDRYTNWCWEYGRIVLRAECSCCEDSSTLSPEACRAPGKDYACSSEGEDGKLEVVSAWFGDPSDPSRRNDITSEVRKQLDDQDPYMDFEVEATTQLWGDPAPQRVKKMEITHERSWLPSPERSALQALQRRAIEKAQSAPDLEALLGRLGAALVADVSCCPNVPEPGGRAEAAAAGVEPAPPPPLSGSRPGSAQQLLGAGNAEPLAPSAPLGQTSPRWRQLGFQSSDPVADLRTGRLALEALIYLAERYPLATGQMVREAQGDGLDYPFAVASINVTQLLARYLQLTSERPTAGISCGTPAAPRRVVQRFARLLLKSPVEDDPFGELHAAVVAHLHTAWRVRKAKEPHLTVADFGPVLEQSLAAVDTFFHTAPLDSAAEFRGLLEVEGEPAPPSEGDFLPGAVVAETARAVTEAAGMLGGYLRAAFAS